MHMKKLLMTATAGMLAAAMFAMPASACGGHHGRRAQTAAQCPVCTVDGCTAAGRHYHDGVCYCGYNHSSGYCDRSCEYAGSGCGGRHHRW